MESQNIQDVIDYLSNQTLEKIEEARSRGIKYVVITLGEDIVDGICSVSVKSRNANTEQEVRDAIKDLGIDINNPQERSKVKIYEVI